MSDVDTPRTPPQLDSEFKGSLAQEYNPKALQILNTYSPFPTFGSRDPFGLDNYLLHPYDAVWEYVQPSSILGENLPESQKRKDLSQADQKTSMRWRSSPLSAPPLISDEEEEAEAANAAARDNTPNVPPRPPRRVVSMSIGTKGLRQFVGRKAHATTGADSPDYPVPTTPEEEEEELTSRPTSMASLVSSSSSSGSSDGSCDGIRTPKEGEAPLDVSACLAAVLQDDERKAASSRSSWRGWLGSKRGSFLGMRGGETGNTLLESPRPSIADIAPDVPKAAGPLAVTDSDAARSAATLRRLSLVKLASLRMPSAHPLAPVLARQVGNLPEEVAFSIPATKRVYPMSVNVLQNTTERAPAQGGLRVALGLRNIVLKIDAGDRPRELLPSRRTQQRTQARQRARGVRDFVTRPPFEQRMVVFSSDLSCCEVSTARPGYAIYDVEFTEYIQALAETEDTPPSLSSPATSPSRAGPPPPRRQPVLRVTNPSPPKDEPSKSTRSGVPYSSFRKSTKPQTWEDSSDEEDAGISKQKAMQVAPVRPRAKRTATAPGRMRDSRVLDADAALDMLTRARERRVEFNSGEVERRAGAEERRKSMMAQVPVIDKRASVASARSPPTERRMPARRMSAMALSTPQLTKEREQAPTMRRGSSSQTLTAGSRAAPPSAYPSGQRTPPRQQQQSGQRTPPRQQQATQRPAASLPASPRPRSSVDRRRVVSTIETQQQPQLSQRASMMSLRMYPQHTGPAMYPQHSGPAMFPQHTGPAMYPQHTGTAMYPQHTGMGSMYTAPPMLPHSQSMIFSPLAVAYQPQFHPHASPSMFVHPPPPATGRRRERPVA